MIQLTAKLFFMPRYEWDDSERPRLGFPVALEQRTHAIQHHTVTLDTDLTKNIWETVVEVIEHMRRLRTIDVVRLGEDVAYNFVVFFMADGSVIIVEGRGAFRSGAHTRGYDSDGVHHNVSGMACALAGDFHNIKININRWVPHLNNAWGMLKFDTPMPNLPIQVDGHTEMPHNATVCPGTHVMKKIERIKAVAIPKEEPDVNPILVILFDQDQPPHQGAYYLSDWLTKRQLATDNRGAELTWYRALRVAEAGIPKARLDEIVTIS